MFSRYTTCKKKAKIVSMSADVNGYVFDMIVLLGKVFLFKAAGEDSLNNSN